MSRAPSPVARFLRQIRAHPRLVVSTAAGTLAFFALPPAVTAATRALVTWDVGAGLYLALAWFMMMRASVEHMRERARIQDDGAAAVLFLTTAAAVASLAAIVMEASGLKSVSPAQQGVHIALVAVTFAASWLLVHTAFALHYAHVYYSSRGGGGAAPLEFPRQDAPVYTDFLYFSMVIGMTFQTAAVAIASTRMRRLVMTQGLIAFVFNTTLLALTINFAAGMFS